LRLVSPAAALITRKSEYDSDPDIEINTHSRLGEVEGYAKCWEPGQKCQVPRNRENNIRDFPIIRPPAKKLLK
jgi:hypothetical protein